jgi:L-malate glycosyltransferase
MKIIYFSLGYSTHDYRFLKAISDGGHEVYFVQLEGNQRQVESRHVPEHVNQVIWKGGREAFKWSKLLSLTLDFRLLTREIKPDLIHAGPIQTCGLVAVLSGFRPTLTMSWGFDLMDDVNKNVFMPLITKYVLRQTDFFTSDANVTKDKAVAYGMNPDKTIVFPWGVDLEHFRMRKAEGGKKEGFVLFCNRS